MKKEEKKDLIEVIQFFDEPETIAQSDPEIADFQLLNAFPTTPDGPYLALDCSLIYIKEGEVSNQHPIIQVYMSKNKDILLSNLPNPEIGSILTKTIREVSPHLNRNLFISEKEK